MVFDIQHANAFQLLKHITEIQAFNLTKCSEKFVGMQNSLQTFYKLISPWTDVANPTQFS